MSGWEKEEGRYPERAGQERLMGLITCKNTFNPETGLELLTMLVMLIAQLDRSQLRLQLVSVRRERAKSRMVKLNGRT